MSKDPIFGSQPKYPAGDPKRQGAPKPGSYMPKDVTVHTPTYEAYGESKSPGPKGHSNAVTSAQPAAKGPWQSTGTEVYPSLSKKPNLFK